MRKTLTYLIAIAALMIISASAMAQGGLAPFVGSTHNYTVTPGDAGNTLLWTLSGGGTLTNEATATATVVWSTPGPYTLTLSETDILTLCVTVKEVTVTVTSAFEVYIEPLTIEECNSANDTINPANNITTVDFVVKMNTGVADWNPLWDITFTLAPGTGATIGTVTASDGSISAIAPYTVTGISAPNSDGTGLTTISVQIIGDAFTELTTAFTITAAQEQDYTISDAESGDWAATATINPIPNTSAISTD